MLSTAFLAELARDFRYAIRRLAQAPGFVVVVVLMLGLGAGATTAIFSVVDALVLRPVPIAHSEQVVRIFETNPTNNAFSMSEPNYLDFRDESRSFAAMAAVGGASATLLDHGDPVALSGSAATASYFSVFRVRPIIGRLYGPDNDVKGGDTHVVLLDADLWARVFGSDASVVGRWVNFDGVSYRVLGVIPTQYGPLKSDYWVPLAPDRGSVRGSHLLAAFGRLREGLSIAAADQDMRAVARRLADAYPTSNGEWGVRLQSFDEWVVGPQLRRQAVLLFGAVGLVLLLACANIANLLLARATVRSREISVRAALGAGRGRIVQQLFTESAVLAAFGVTLGLVLAWGALPIVRAVSPGVIPRLDEAVVNGRALLFSVMLAACTSIAFGLAPALHVVRGDLHHQLRQGARSVSPSGRRSRDGLVVFEMALAVLLLIAAGLFGRSFLKLEHVPIGFQPAGLLQLDVTTPNDWPAPRRSAYFHQVEDAIRTVPGVQSVGMTSIAPFSGGTTNTQFLAEGHESDRSSFYAADWRTVSPGIFATLGVPLIRGRELQPNDLADHPLVAVISEEVAHRFWPGEDPIGKRIMAAQARQRVYEVVGVVGDVRDQSLGSDQRPAVYFPLDQKPWFSMSIFIRPRGAPAPLIATVKNALRTAVPTTAVPELTILTTSMGKALTPQRFTAGLLVAFAVIAVVLATLGVYGIISYGVAQRTAEMGVRVALGAAPERVVAMILREGGVLALAGIVSGAIVAVLLARGLSSLLFGVRPGDPVTYIVVIVFQLVVTALATYIPASRAARTDPLVALRTG